MDPNYKKTVLDDSASIYNNRENKTEKQKWSEMNGKQKFEYFRNYYLMKIVAIIAVACVLISIVYTMATNKTKDRVISIASYDNILTQSVQEKLITDLTALLVTDSENEEAAVDSYYSSDYSSEMAFSVKFFSNEYDIVVMPESVFATKANAGFCASLSEYLTEEQYEKYSEYILSYQVYDDDGNLKEGSEVDCGIYIDYLPLFDGMTFTDRPVLGVITTENNTENVKAFLNYLFNDEN